MKLEDKKDSKKLSVRKIIVYSISLLVFALFIYVMIAGTKALKENRPIKMFGYSYSVIPTPSMEPTIKVNDIIIIDYTSYEDLKVGDIIVYNNSELGINISHRIIDVYEDGTFKTKGDNNYDYDKYSNNEDIHITKEMYIGKVINYGSFLGLGWLILNGRNVIFGLIIIIFGYMLISEIINIIKISKEKEKLKLTEDAKNIQNNIDAEREKLKKEVLEELEKEKLDNKED